MISPLSFYKCLADDTRLKSLLLITVKKELCVCDLISALDLSQPKVSRHLAELRKCKILVDERRGKWVFYSLNPELPNWALIALEQTANQASEYIDLNLQALSSVTETCC